MRVVFIKVCAESIALGVERRICGK